jgi:hypothetical protein
MAALRELVARFTTEFDSKPLEKGAAAIDSVFGKLQKLGTALMGGAIVGGLAAFTARTIAAGDEIATTAERIGLSTQALQEWTYVADLADVSADELGAAFKFASKNIYDAANGGKESAEAFAALGINVRDANGDMLQADSLIETVAVRFAQMNDPVEKTALAMKVFGKGGAALIPLLNKGAEGIGQLRSEFIALGSGLSNETVAAANDADDAFKRLKFGWNNLTSNAMRPFIVMATRGAEILTKWVKILQALTKNSSIVQTALVALGGAAVAAIAPIVWAFAPLLATTLAWAAGLGFAALVLEDIITFFRGGKSVLGDWIDATWGIGTSSKVLETVRGWWDDLSGAVSDAGVWLDGISPKLKDVGRFFSYIGQTIAFVVDQLRHLDQFSEGALKIARDIAVKIGYEEETADEKKFKHGAEGFGTGQATDRGGFFADAQRLPGDAPRRETTGPVANQGFNFAALPPPPVARSMPAGQSVVNHNTTTIKVDANARPDPELIPTIKKAIQETQAKQARSAQAGMG